MSSSRTYRDFINYTKAHGLENSLMLYYSTYHAIVIDNNDPDQQARIKVKVPQITGDEEINEWILPNSTYAGKNVGFVAVPDVDDGVWVSFKNGNPRFPVYTGGWWANPQNEESGVPQEARGEDYPYIRLWKTTSGHFIRMNDKQKVFDIFDANGNKLVMDSKTVELANQDGANIKLEDFLVKLNGEKEPAVLGDTNASVLTDTLNELKDTIAELNNLIILMNVTFTAQGAAFPLLAPAAIAFTSGIIPIVTQLANVTAKIATTTANVPNTLSKKVKLD